MGARSATIGLAFSLLVASAHAQVCPSGPPCVGGPLPAPLPLFPSSNWWNQDVSGAPVDPGSAAYIAFIGDDRLHPDFGGEVSPGSVDVYGMPYVVVAGSQPKRTVSFEIADESDGPFYPIPDEAITEPHWIEHGEPGNVFVPDVDRHLLIVDRDNRLLYELYNAYHDGTGWTAYSGAIFDMKTDGRRPETWTSADAAGLAVLPGLVRYDEACGTAPLIHALRVTVRATNGYVWPASHRAGSTSGALPLGARLRLKAGVDISATRFPDPCVRRVFQAMKTYGLIVADNGSDMYVTGTFDPRWPAAFDAGFHPQFKTLRATDFEVVKLGWHPVFVSDATVTEGNAGTTTAAFTVTLLAPADRTVTVSYAAANGTATAGSDYVATSGALTFPPGTVTRTISVTVNGDATFEPDETFFVNLSGAVNADITDGQGQGTITNEDPEGTVSVADVAVAETTGGTTTATFTVSLSNPVSQTVTVSYATADGTATAPADYAAAAGPLTFDPGVVTRTVPVFVVGDATVELDETFTLGLSGATGAALGDAVGLATILDDDALSTASRELSHGAIETQSLAALPGPVADVDDYRLAQSPRGSYEVVVDAASGDVLPLDLARLGADHSTVLQSSIAIGAGPSRSLRWQNLTPATVANQLVRVRSGGCTTACGTDDAYRIRFRETTGSIPRFNNSGSQVSVLLLHNSGTDSIAGTLHFWSPAGALLHTQLFTVPPRGLFSLNAQGVAALQGQSGAVTVSHDGRHGDLSGKSVALEPATGFSFDSPLIFRP